MVTFNNFISFHPPFLALLVLKLLNLSSSAFLELPEQEAVESPLTFMTRSPGEVGDVVGIFLESFKTSMW